MAPTTTQLLGHVINDQYRLLEYLGGSEHSSVFLTEYGDSGQKVAIKLVATQPAQAEIQLSRWELASQFPHPHLIQLLDAGRCDLADTSLIYVVMEYAPENLSQVLTERALTAEETADMLESVLKVFEFLHSNGFAHGHLKPSNILAIDDSLKLSSDTIGRFDEAWDSGRNSDAFDAPEMPGGKFAAPGDLWSLGTTIVEALTLRLPAFDSQQPPAPIVQDTLPAVFRDIAENCLIRDPESRWTAGEVNARAHGTLPVRVRRIHAKPQPEVRLEAEPESQPVVSPRHAAAPEISRPAAPQARRETQLDPRREPETEPPKTWRYLAAIAGAALVLAAIFVGPKLLHPAAPSTSVAQTAMEMPVGPAQSSAVPEIPQPNAPEQKAAATSAPPSPPSVSQNSAGRTAPGSPPAGTAPSSAAAAAWSGGAAQAAVLSKVLPNISDRARGTIHGTVHVAVKVDVDSSGNVTNAVVDPAGPSKYFSDASIQAAHGWKFKPRELNGQAAPSQWMVHFLFTQTDTTAFSTAP